MANQKRTSKKNSGGTRRKSTTASKSRTRTSGKKTGGRRRAGEENEIPEALFTEIGILFLLAFCVILVLGNFGLTLRFGDVFNSFFFGLFGGMEYLFPFCFFGGVCYYLVHKDNFPALFRLMSGIVLFFDAGMFLQLFVTADYNLGGYSGTYDYSMSNRSGGGVLSGALFELLKKNIGQPATIIIMVVVLLICLIILTGSSIIKLLSYPGSEIADRARESRDERKKDIEAIREERAILRAEERERRAVRRAEEREEKRRRYRENTLNKKKNRSFIGLSVGDENKNAAPEENSYLQNDIFAYEKDLSAESVPEKEPVESQGYSPFAMDPAHMIKPKDYDKKSEPQPLPESRLKEAVQDKDSFDFDRDFGPDFEVTETDIVSDMDFNIPEPLHEEDSAPLTEEAPDETEALNKAREEKEERFYNELMQSHEIELSDMHEITIDDDGPESVYLDNDAYPVPDVSKEERVSEEEPDRGKFPDEKLPDMEEMIPDEEDLPDIEEISYTEDEEPDEPEDPFDIEEIEDPSESEDISEHEDFEEPDELPEDEDEEKEPEPEKPYELPPVSLLKRGKAGTKESEGSLRATADKLQKILSSFGVGVRMLNYIQGPTVTRFEMQPEQGVKVNTILNLSNDIQMNLAAKDIRIEAPIPGKAAVGIEIPNKSNSPVMLRELIESDAFRNSKSKITIAVGKDIGGEAIVYDIDKMPHLLIAGATGSGKSVCINTIVMSILYKAKPDEVKLIMIDPKVVELSIYNGIPHLMTPVVTDPVKAAGALNWGVAEMMKRYQLFARAHVRNMEGYNEKVPELNRKGETLSDGSPYTVLPEIVIIVDELADLMMVQKKDVEASICRLAQLARAAGIHLIIATQRPSVDVITGLIKANMPSRVAFAVSSNVDSRTILDSAGAEKLLGNGDMLFYPQKYPKPERLQGAFVSDEEVQDVTDFIRGQVSMDNPGSNDISAEIEAAAASGGSKESQDEGPNPLDNDDGRDSYFSDAGRFVTEKKKATIGVLQRMFRIGFNRAARIMDQLAEAGVVSGEDGTKPRQVLMTKEEFEEFLINEDNESEVEDED